MALIANELYRENLFEEMLQEPDEVATKRKQTRDKLRILNQAFRVGFFVKLLGYKDHFSVAHIIFLLHLRICSLSDFVIDLLFVHGC